VGRAPDCRLEYLDLQLRPTFRHQSRRRHRPHRPRACYGGLASRKPLPLREAVRPDGGERSPRQPVSLYLDYNRLGQRFDGRSLQPSRAHSVDLQPSRDRAYLCGECPSRWCFPFFGLHQVNIRERHRPDCVPRPPPRDRPKTPITRTPPDRLPCRDLAHVKPGDLAFASVSRARRRLQRAARYGFPRTAPRPRLLHSTAHDRSRSTVTQRIFPIIAMAPPTSTSGCSPARRDGRDRRVRRIEGRRWPG